MPDQLKDLNQPSSVSDVLSAVNEASQPSNVGDFAARADEATRAIEAKCQELRTRPGEPLEVGDAHPDGVKAGENTGFFCHFANASIFWFPGLGAHEVHGAIRDKYGELGYEKSILGYPISDETGDSDRRINYFQNHEQIVWTPEAGAIAGPTL